MSGDVIYGILTFLVIVVFWLTVKKIPHNPSQHDGEQQHTLRHSDS